MKAQHSEELVGDVIVVVVVVAEGHPYRGCWHCGLPDGDHCQQLEHVGSVDCADAAIDVGAGAAGGDAAAGAAVAYAADDEKPPRPATSYWEDLGCQIGTFLFSKMYEFEFIYDTSDFIYYST